MNWEPHLVREVKDEQAGLHGFLVLDTVVNGRSCGGVRMVEDVTLDEVKSLARAMTLKYSFLNDPSIGGAKAGIQIPAGCPAEKKNQLLRSFGHHIAPILKSKQYIPWTEMNAGPEDIAAILKAAGAKPGRIPDSAYPTALSVLGSIQAACRFKGLKLPEITVAIEGLGNVGANLAKELSKFGYKIAAVSTRSGARYDKTGLDVVQIIESRRSCGDDFILHHQTGEPIDKKDLLELDVDVLVPAARPWTINEQNAARIKAKIIAPAANRPITDTAEAILHERNILSVPDFVANLGGVYGSRLAGRVSREKIRHLFLNEYSIMLERLLQRAHAEGCSPSALATRIAIQNRHRIMENSENYTRKAKRLMGRAALAVIDSPVTPGWIVDRMLHRWAKKDLYRKVI